LMIVSLKYFCTATSKNLLTVFQILDKLYLAGNDVNINWYCVSDNEDMMEEGNEYKSILSLPFNLIIL